MDALHQLDIRRRHANLESNLQAHFSFGLLAGFQNAPGARDVDGYGLFAINVLTRRHRGLQMLHMEVGRSRYDHRVNILRIEDLLVRMSSQESFLDARLAFCRGEFVYLLLGFIQAVLKHVRQHSDSRIRVFQNCFQVRGAAPSASQQSHAHG